MHLHLNSLQLRLGWSSWPCSSLYEQVIEPAASKKLNSCLYLYLKTVAEPASQLF